MNRTGIDLKEGKILYSPKESDDVLLLEETKEEIEKLSLKEVIEFIKEKLSKLIK